MHTPEHRTALKAIGAAASACYAAKIKPRNALKGLLDLPEGADLQDKIRKAKAEGINLDAIRPLLKAEFGGGETGTSLYREAEPMMAVETDPELADATGRPIEKAKDYYRNQGGKRVHVTGYEAAKKASKIANQHEGRGAMHAHAAQLSRHAEGLSEAASDANGHDEAAKAHDDAAMAHERLGVDEAAEAHWEAARQHKSDAQGKA